MVSQRIVLCDWTLRVIKLANILSIVWFKLFLSKVLREKITKNGQKWVVLCFFGVPSLSAKFAAIS